MHREKRQGIDLVNDDVEKTLVKVRTSRQHTHYQIPKRKGHLLR